jgi:hypothetical protein
MLHEPSSVLGLPLEPLVVRARDAARIDEDQRGRLSALQVRLDDFVRGL